MIEQDVRNAIFLLHKEGMGIRQISRHLHLSRNTIRNIIKQAGKMPLSVRGDKIQIDPDLLRQYYKECSGFIQRIHERLSDEGTIVGYSTLSRMIRDLGLGQEKGRCAHVPDTPGEEMQHDTTVYKVRIGDIDKRIIGSLLYLRYCKRRYLKFYPVFNRFIMKCFFHEALSFFGYTASFCIIDNTNLARLRGTGKNAIIVPEMEQFARQFGFEFLCHEVGHPNRKAGSERGFYTVETNFFPGRRFESLEDLNSQAKDWATLRIDNRPQKGGLIPAKAFEHEVSYLKKLPPFVPLPYLVHKRGTDQYGYIPFSGNYYWVPGTTREDVKVLQYPESIKIYKSRQLLTEYQLPPYGVKNKHFSPQGATANMPKHRVRPTLEEEKRLRAISAEVDEYLNFALKPKGQQRHRFIRALFGLYQKIATPLFIKATARALRYRITDIRAFERIAILQLNSGDDLPFVDIDKEFKNRQAYQDGCITQEADLSIYDKIWEENDG